jgi:hypothetical protein
VYNAHINGEEVRMLLHSENGASDGRTDLGGVAKVRARSRVAHDNGGNDDGDGDRPIIRAGAGAGASAPGVGAGAGGDGTTFYGAVQLDSGVTAEVAAAQRAGSYRPRPDDVSAGVGAGAGANAEDEELRLLLNPPQRRATISDDSSVRATVAFTGLSSARWDDRKTLKGFQRDRRAQMQARADAGHGDTGSGLGRLFSSITVLRKVCNHADLALVGANDTRDEKMAAARRSVDRYRRAEAEALGTGGDFPAAAGGGGGGRDGSYRVGYDAQGREVKLRGADALVSEAARARRRLYDQQRAEAAAAKAGAAAPAATGAVVKRPRSAHAAGIGAAGRSNSNPWAVKTEAFAGAEGKDEGDDSLDDFVENDSASQDSDGDDREQGRGGAAWLGPRPGAGAADAGDRELRIARIRDYGAPERSGKLLVLLHFLAQWQPQGHRVLIFTQSRQTLDIVEKAVAAARYTCLRLDGATPVRSRIPLVARFNRDPSVFAFLLTTKAGGLGINLTGADRVVIFDPDWNPATDMQAQDRAYRIGQRRPVKVYSLVTKGTIEEKILHRQLFKKALAACIVKTNSNSSSVASGGGGGGVGGVSQFAAAREMAKLRSAMTKDALHDLFGAPEPPLSATAIARMKVFQRSAVLASEDPGREGAAPRAPRAEAAHTAAADAATAAEPAADTGVGADPGTDVDAKGLDVSGSGVVIVKQEPSLSEEQRQQAQQPQGPRTEAQLVMDLLRERQQQQQQQQPQQLAGQGPPPQQTAGADTEQSIFARVMALDDPNEADTDGAVSTAGSDAASVGFGIASVSAVADSAARRMAAEARRRLEASARAKREAVRAQLEMRRQRAEKLTADAAPRKGAGTDDLGAGNGTTSPPPPVPADLVRRQQQERLRTEAALRGNGAAAATGAAGKRLAKPGLPAAVLPRVPPSHLQRPTTAPLLPNQQPPAVPRPIVVPQRPVPAPQQAAVSAYNRVYAPSKATVSHVQAALAARAAAGAVTNGANGNGRASPSGGAPTPPDAGPGAGGLTSPRGGLASPRGGLISPSSTSGQASPAPAGAAPVPAPAAAVTAAAAAAAAATAAAAAVLMGSPASSAAPAQSLAGLGVTVRPRSYVHPAGSAEATAAAAAAAAANTISLDSDNDSDNGDDGARAGARGIGAGAGTPAAAAAAAAAAPALSAVEAAARASASSLAAARARAVVALTKPVSAASTARQTRFDPSGAISVGPIFTTASGLAAGIRAGAAAAARHTPARPAGRQSAPASKTLLHQIRMNAVREANKEPPRRRDDGGSDDEAEYGSGRRW